MTSFEGELSGYSTLKVFLRIRIIIGFWRTNTCPESYWCAKKRCISENQTNDYERGNCASSILRITKMLENHR